MELGTETIRPLRVDEVRNARGLVGFQRDIASRPKGHRRHSQFANLRRGLAPLRAVASASGSLGRRLVKHQGRLSALLRREVTAQKNTRIAASVELQPFNGSV